MMRNIAACKIQDTDSICIQDMLLKPKYDHKYTAGLLGQFIHFFFFLIHNRIRLQY